MLISLTALGTNLPIRKGNLGANCKSLRAKTLASILVVKFRQLAKNCTTRESKLWTRSGVNMVEGGGSFLGDSGGRCGSEMRLEETAES